MKALLPLLSALVGCSEMDMLAGKGDNETPSEDVFQAGTLRLDIHPPSGLASPELLPQTVLAMPPRYSGLEVELRPTISVFGTLLAEVAHPWSATGVPTETVPLAGVVSAAVDASVQNGKVATDGSGAFALALVADNFYDLTIVPADASASPLVALDGLDLQADQDLGQTLPTGIPVYGRVTNADGTALPEVPVRIRRTDGANNTPSSVVHTDRTGWYTVRVADPGEYLLEIVGGRTDHGDVVPGLSAPVAVPDAEGATLYVDVGVLTRATLSGVVRDAEGRGLESATVRLESTSLVASGGALVVEETTRSGGNFTADLLPGTYTVTFVPDYDPDPAAAPVSVRVDVPAGDTDLGVQTLPGIGRLTGHVVSASGTVAAGARIVAEQEMSGFVYTATTDQQGDYALDIPIASYAVTVWPAPGTDGAVTQVVRSPGQSGDVELASGEPVSGRLTWDGIPVPYALVDVRELRSGRLLGNVTTDAEGVFAVEVVVPDEDTGGEDSGATDTAGTSTGTSGSDSGTTATGTTDTGGGGTETGGADTAADTGATDTGGTPAR